MKELFSDLADLFPYCLIVALPVFIALSPINPVEAARANEFPAYRAQHMEFGGAVVGAKGAALNMEARGFVAAVKDSAKGGGGGISVGNVLRKVVVAKLQDLSVSALTELSANGAGGFLLLVPGVEDADKLSADQRDSILTLEDHLLTTEIQIPVYLTEETEQTLELLNTLASSNQGTDDKKVSGAQALLDGIISNGFQLVSSASNPKLASDQSILTIEAAFNGVSESGLGEEDTLPTVVVAAHYDASSGSPALSFGADSNGSGVTILMELARLWSHLYRTSSRSRPGFNLIFLLTGGGKINFLGTKKWLDEQKDNANSELFNNIKMAVCLDSLGFGDDIYMHVSKPPKEGTTSHNFLDNLKALSKKMYPNKNMKVEMVHKKINLASDYLAWEHERFSISKLSAFTLSRHPTAFSPDKTTVLDRKVDTDAVVRNVHLLAEAVACTVYGLNGEACLGQVFARPDSDQAASKSGSVAKFGPSSEAVRMWTDEMASKPRPAALMTSNNPTVKLLISSMKELSDDVREHVMVRDKRDPEFAFYDTHSATVSAYRVKPAVFDLLLTMAIGAYLGLVYLMLHNFSSIYKLVAALTNGKSCTNGVSTATNGHSNGKFKSH